MHIPSIFSIVFSGPADTMVWVCQVVAAFSFLLVFLGLYRETSPARNVGTLLGFVGVTASLFLSIEGTLTNAGDYILSGKLASAIVGNNAQLWLLKSERVEQEYMLSAIVLNIVLPLLAGLLLSLPFLLRSKRHHRHCFSQAGSHA